MLVRRAGDGQAEEAATKARDQIKGNEEIA
jgi:hypothetical protein